MKKAVAAQFSSMITALLFAAGCIESDPGKTVAGETEMTAEDAGLVILRPDDVAYVPLNPARGDAAPQAGVLWGDIRQDTDSGALLRFADGFSSPPHIHNITYRAIVIEGEIHNAPPDASKNWMGPGSFWVQAAGEDHITAAKPGSSSLALLEILSGPYLVKPSEESFASSDVSRNIHAAEIKWLPAEKLGWLHPHGSGGEIEFTQLWGNPETGEPNGRFVRLGEGSSATLLFEDSATRAIVIQGSFEHQITGVSKPLTLGTGGFFSTNAAVENRLTCRAKSCVVYLRTL